MGIGGSGRTWKKRKKRDETRATAPRGHSHENPGKLAHSHSPDTRRRSKRPIDHALPLESRCPPNGQTACAGMTGWGGKARGSRHRPQKSPWRLGPGAFLGSLWKASARSLPCYPDQRPVPTRRGSGWPSSWRACGAGWPCPQSRWRPPSGWPASRFRGWRGC